jgi:hypothetical protein
MQLTPTTLAQISAESVKLLAFNRWGAVPNYPVKQRGGTTKRSIPSPVGFREAASEAVSPTVATGDDLALGKSTNMSNEMGVHGLLARYRPDGVPGGDGWSGRWIMQLALAGGL